MTDPYRSGSYGQDHPDWHAADATLKADAVLAALHAAGWYRPSSFLDVGCGTGDVLHEIKRHLDALGKQGVHYEGWDVAAEAIARGHQVEGVSLNVGDALTQAARSDIVLCLDVVEHLDDDEAFLRALRRLGDRFVFRLPLDRSTLTTVRPAKLAALQQRYGHVQAYTRREALRRLKRTGYVPEVVQFHRVPPSARTPREQAVDGVRRAAFRLAPRTTARLLGGWSLVVAARTR